MTKSQRIRKELYLNELLYQEDMSLNYCREIGDEVGVATATRHIRHLNSYGLALKSAK